MAGGGSGGNITGPAISSSWRLNSSSPARLLSDLVGAAGRLPRMQLLFHCPEAAVGADTAKTNAMADGSACPAVPLPAALEGWQPPAAADVRCHTAHDGELCGACAEGHWLHGRRCEECSDFARQKFGLPLGAVVGLAVAMAAAVAGGLWAMRKKLRRLKNLVRAPICRVCSAAGAAGCAVLRRCYCLVPLAVLLCLIIHSTEGWSPLRRSNQIATNAKIVLGLAQVCYIPPSHITHA